MLSELCEAFVRYLRSERHLASATVDTWRPLTRAFITWLRRADHEPTVLDFNDLLLQQYLCYLREEKHARPRYVRSIFSALRAFGDYLVTEHYLAANPVVGIALPRLDPPRRDLISDDEVKGLLNACECIHKERRRALARALCCVFLYGALQRCECLALRLSDLDFTTGSLSIADGKGDKRRTIHPDPRLFAALREWIRQRPHPCQHNYLFAYDSRRRLHADGLMDMLEEVKAIAGLATHTNIKPHTLRHYCAVRLYRSGYDLESLCAFLGHQSITTTALYLYTSCERFQTPPVPRPPSSLTLHPAAPLP